ncbi:very low-density lipoprotein receptor-like [Oppia nitens]|uniref:very low-density lipoprotein receptor-like n=1 Tax=Oppia nitens TaxID=1686743 RepID=UPI0023DABFB2|nr:very low-density lipoprotein receptor-like [Oppia nitens]
MIIAAIVASLIITNVSSDCSFQQFECQDNSKCIPFTWRCDGDVDCPDNSDELNCTVKLCTQNEFKCQNGKCLPHKWICDNEDDCGDRSDELNCATQTCTDDQFKCVATNNCIPGEWVCDDTEDCTDGSDEKQCKTNLVSCRQNEFTCDNGKCLINRWVCDGEDDCGDKSDESQHLCANKTCGSDMFTCNSGKCIPDRWKCDGDRDCPDSDDERGCRLLDRLANETICGPSDFQCFNGHECISSRWRCDRSKDCTDGSDEVNCTYICRADQFMCNNGNCIPEQMLCNGEQECADGSDENNCPEKTDHTSDSTNTTDLCKPSEYRCVSTNPLKCIELSKVCDGINDCDDWSDEPPNCKLNECLGKHHCSQNCVDDLSGYHCECKKGYRLGSDNKTCDNIDECAEQYGLCSGHMCFDQKGHYKCQCFDGYEVKDHRFCKIKGEEKPLLVFANRHDIRTLDISHKHKHQHYLQLYAGLASTIGIDYSIKDNYIIWSDVTNEKLFIAPLNNSHKTFNGLTEPTELIENKGVVDALAVDWIHRLVYWTDTSKDHIEVANISDPNSRAVIISDSLEEPRGIAVNVLESWIVWTDWGSRPRIERALQDGSNRKTLVDRNIIWPNGVTIDLITKQIYWLDAKMNTINSVNFDGSSRRQILHSPDFIRHPFSLDIFEDNIYWTDWELESVLATNKFGIDNHKVDTLVGGVFSVMDISIVHSYKKPHSNDRCADHRCSHLCLPTGRQSYRCVCPTAMQLKDNQTCEPIDSSTAQSVIDSAIQTSTGTNSLVPPVVTTKSSSSSVTTESIEDIELMKSHNKNKIKHYKENHKNHTTDDKDYPAIVDESDGKLAIIITVILLCVLLFIAATTLMIYRRYQRRSITSMNFDNPVYRKTTEDQFALEKSDDSLSSYPSSLEPLTSPGTNEFV